MRSGGRNGTEQPFVAVAWEKHPRFRDSTELEAKNLLGIYSSLKNFSLEKTIKQFSGRNFSDFKKDLSQVLVDKIDPISKEIKKLLKESDFLDKILLEGSNKANEIASEKLKKIHEIVGF